MNSNYKKSAIIDAITDRKSVRGFLKKPVPKKLINKIFKLSTKAPSNCNIQPWYVYVSSGKSKDRLKKEMVNNVLKGIKPNSDYQYPENFTFNITYLKRQVMCAKLLYDEMGIKKSDIEARKKAVLRNYKFYDAPHVCFIGMHEKFGSSIALDVGIYVQTLMLSMNAYGVACCPQATLRDYPDLIRKEFNISSSIKILLGISFGFESKSVKANKVKMPRADMEENFFLKF